MKELLKKSENKIFICTLFGLGLAAWISVSQFGSAPKANAASTDTPEAAIDTLIPKGYVLVPIELTNAEPLSSLIGSTAVVDLYLSTVDKSKSGHKVGSRIKLMRAPLNPQLFAVLVKDSESDKILAQPGPYFAVLQNHAESSGEIKTQKLNSIEIKYQR